MNKQTDKQIYAKTYLCLRTKNSTVHNYTCTKSVKCSLIWSYIPVMCQKEKPPNHCTMCQTMLLLHASLFHCNPGLNCSTEKILRNRLKQWPTQF